MQPPEFTTDLVRIFLAVAVLRYVTNVLKWPLAKAEKKLRQLAAGGIVSVWAGVGVGSVALFARWLPGQQQGDLPLFFLFIVMPFLIALGLILLVTARMLFWADDPNAAEPREEDAPQ